MSLLNVFACCSTLLSLSKIKCHVWVFLLLNCLKTEVNTLAPIIFVKRQAEVFHHLGSSIVIDINRCIQCSINILRFTSWRFLKVKITCAQLSTCLNDALLSRTIQFIFSLIWTICSVLSAKNLINNIHLLVRYLDGLFLLLSWFTRVTLLILSFSSFHWLKLLGVIVWHLLDVWLIGSTVVQIGVYVLVSILETAWFTRFLAHISFFIIIVGSPGLRFSNWVCNKRVLVFLFLHVIFESLLDDGFTLSVNQDLTGIVRDITLVVVEYLHRSFFSLWVTPWSCFIN